MVLIFMDKKNKKNWTLKSVGLFIAAIVSSCTIINYSLSFLEKVKGPDFKITMLPVSDWRNGRRIMTISNWNGDSPVKSTYSLEAHYYYMLSKIDLSNVDNVSNYGIQMYDLNEATHNNYNNVTGTGLLGETFFKGPVMNYSKYKFIHSKVKIGNRVYKRKIDEKLNVVAYVRVFSGKKYYYFLVQPGGKQKRISIDKYCDVTNNSDNDIGGSLGYYTNGEPKYSTFPKFYSGKANFFENARKYIIQNNIQRTTRTNYY